MNQQELSVPLRDIQGLDAISGWPPAPAWWLLGLLILLLLTFASLLAKRLIKGEPLARLQWQRDAARQLRQLQKRIARDDIQILSAELSELMRRIAIARCGRKHCAGLFGEDWLTWLSEHDPKGFGWDQYRQLLLHAPYAPPGHTGDSSDIRKLINAALTWTQPGSRECAIQQSVEHV